MKNEHPAISRAVQELTLDFDALRAQNRSIEEHALCREIENTARASEANGERLVGAIENLLADTTVPDTDKAREMLMLAAGLGIGAQAGRLPGMRGVTQKLPGMDRPEVQGLAEGLTAPLRVAVMHAPLVSPAIMAGIAAQTEALAQEADASLGSDGVLAARVEEEVAALQEDAVHAAEVEEAEAAEAEAIANDQPLPSSRAVAREDQSLPSEAQPVAEKRRPSLLFQMLAMRRK